MKVGCLQFAPKLGEVKENIRKADSLLEDTSSSELDLLVLPEMAFSGEYCFGIFW
jgi:protein N-terminal amidase